MEPFKNIYNSHSILKLAEDIKQVHPAFDSLSFQKFIIKNLNELELKDRVRLIATGLHEFLPENFKKTVKILINSLSSEEEHELQQWSGLDGDGVRGFMVWPLCQYIEDHGIRYFDESMQALYEMTKRFSAEFSIRPFIEYYDNKVYELLSEWREDSSKHVRRLVSEGTRPNLPWGIKVQNINKNLIRNIDLIEKLKNDQDEYVRKSVANHLNDISRIDKNLMLSTCENWMLAPSNEIQWIIRHACRSLLKSGNLRALELNGFTTKPLVELNNLRISGDDHLITEICEGDRFMLEFELKSLSTENQNLLIDYEIVFPKKFNKTSTKVFRLKKLELKTQECVHVSKMVTFKKVTTRTHYPGLHKIYIKVAGKNLGNINFNLLLG